MHAPVTNPYAPPAADEPQPLIPQAQAPTESGQQAQATLQALGRGKHEGGWRIELFDNRMAVTGPDGVLRVYARAAIPAELKIAPLGAGPMLVIESEKIPLQLQEEDAEALRRWLGPGLTDWGDAQSLRSTKVALWFGVGLSALLLLHVSPIVLVLAVAYLVAGVGRLLRPGRWLFLVAALRSAGLIVAVVFDLFVLDASWWLALFGLLFLFNVKLSWRLYRFFAPVDHTNRL